MRAIGYNTPGPIDVQDALVEFEVPTPTVGPRDLLVEIKGISVNPVDTKVRGSFPAEGGTKIIGYDAAGIVKAVGSDVSLFKVGDEVFYAGDITRPGTNAELHVVDERIVGHKPKSLDFATAAGLALTSITAWELLFDSLALTEGRIEGSSKKSGSGESILIIGAAGGVGSILIQLAKQLTGLKVIATASREDTVEWVKAMGADYVINHREPLVEQLNRLNLKPLYVASLNGTQEHFASIIELIKPKGRVAVIDDPESLDILSGKGKSLSFSWEFMFAHSMHNTEDMIKQHELLNRVSTLIDSGVLKSTVTTNLGPLSVDTLTAAHQQQEGGRVIGKNVLSGF